MKLMTTVCSVDIDQDLKDLKEEMLKNLDNDMYIIHEVYSIFNGQFYMVCPWVKTIEDIKFY